MAKYKYDFVIDFNNYVLHTDKSKEESEKIVENVNERIKEARGLIKYNNRVMYATLAAINIADELFSIRNEYNNIKENASKALENYEPLKEQYSHLYSVYNTTVSTINDIKESNEKYKKRIEELSLENKKLSSLIEEDKSKVTRLEKENKDLFDSLFSQEKEIKELKKQITELRNRK